MKIKKHFIILSIILFATFLMRFPSLYEPFWYGDEGIFAGVAINLNQGGTLYKDAWDNKPPMIYLTYASIFQFLGVSMFSLRIVTIIIVMMTAAAIYEIAEAAYGIRRALIATFAFGAISSLRLIEGNLSLTEIFMIFPICAAMLVVIKRKFDYHSLYLAGFLFAIASLYKQVGAFEAAAVGIFLFLSEKSFFEFIKKSLILTLGFIIPYALVIIYFAPQKLIGEYIFAAYTYYSQSYLKESPQYTIFINVAKFLPIVAAVVYGLFKKYKKEKIDLFHLFLLWSSLSFLGSYFSGRTYGHYLVQAVPAVSLLLASIPTKFSFKKQSVIFAIIFITPILFLTRILFSDFISGGPINQVRYFSNFISFARGNKSLWEYNNYFDHNVNTIMSLSDFLKMHGKNEPSVYIWGDMSWLYAIGNLRNPSRYVTSFHVFGVGAEGEGRAEVASDLSSNPPDYIIKNESNIGYFPELERILGKRYTFVSKVETASIYARHN